MNTNEALKDVLAVMRQDFKDIARLRCERLYWTKTDVDDYAAAIKATTEGKTEMDDGICVWWVWLKDTAADERMWRESGEQCIARIKARIAADRAAKIAA